jgi:hypothetical protein
MNTPTGGIAVIQGARTAFAAVVLLLVCGCVSVERFPSSWGVQPTGVQCAATAGTYEDKGIRADGLTVFLGSWLNATLQSNSPERFQVAHDLHQAQTVELRLEGTLLYVTAIGTEVRRAWTFDSSKGQFKCSNGVIHILRWQVDSDIVLLTSKETIDLYGTKDYLFVNVHGGGAGLAMVLPVAGYSSVWARFPARGNAAPESAPQQ